MEALKHAIQTEFSTEFQEIDWQKEDEPPPLEDLATEVVFHAVREVARNAAIHGRGKNRDFPLRLAIAVNCDDFLVIRVADNGIGIENNSEDQAEPGGLSLHATMMAVVGGSLTASAAPSGTEVTLSLPIGG